MQNEHDWSGRIHAICAEAAHAAANNIVHLSQQLDTVARVKGPGDFVTNIDVLSEAKINAVLQSHGYTDAQIISEESSENSAGLPEQGWVVDPLDGTSAFLFGCGAHNISVIVTYCENYLPVVAEIVFPFTGEHFSAIRNKGARYNGKPLSISTGSEDLSEYWIMLNRFGDSAHETPFMKRLDGALRGAGGAGLVTAEVPNSGATCRVAEGRIGAIVHDNSPVAPKQCVWDIAGPKLLLEEAGGVCVDKMGQSYRIGSHEPMIAARSLALASAICQAAE